MYSFSDRCGKRKQVVASTSLDRFYTTTCYWFKEEADNLLAYCFDLYNSFFITFYDITSWHTMSVYFNGDITPKFQVAIIGKNDNLEQIHPWRVEMKVVNNYK